MQLRSLSPRQNPGRGPIPRILNVDYSQSMAEILGDICNDATQISSYQTMTLDNIRQLPGVSSLDLNTVVSVVSCASQADYENKIKEDALQSPFPLALQFSAHNFRLHVNAEYDSRFLSSQDMVRLLAQLDIVWNKLGDVSLQNTPTPRRQLLRSIRLRQDLAVELPKACSS